jgi:predicted enzyme related to lactoylglutathione lyase
MPRVAHFEIPADDPERVADFYRKAFGWGIKKWDGPVDYWLVMTGSADEPGIDGGIAKGEPGTGVALSVDVDDVDAYLERVKEAGGKIVKEKHAVPGVGWLVYCADTEGNVFGMMQEDRNAK